ncbi:MFS transporter [Acidithiobacillus sp. AMEEHan]|uniref:MFS transporter n=1 Tax=Acidithiobacillus sp. AMEEHan TaxID=2994951 RepID=UPI0027E542B7|nr:MFS transporter [Acidithiobacillus sp. AMEEHan]
MHLLRQLSIHRQVDRFLAANISVGIAHFLVLFNAGAYLPMIPRISGSLGRAPLYGDWTQDLYFLALGLSLPLAPWVSRRWGDRDGLLACLLALFVTALLNAVTQDYAVFLLARVAAGFAGGLSIPLSLNILLRHYHAKHRSIGLLLWGFAAVTPFALGPFVGGWIADVWGWRWLFLLNLPILLASFLGVLFWEEASSRGPARFDWFGYLLFCAALLSAEMAFNLGSRDDWWRSGEFRLLFLGALILLSAAILWSRSHEQAAVDLRPFRHLSVALAAAGIFSTALVFQGTLALLIVQYQLAFGYSADAIGKILLSLAIFAPLSVALSHWYLARFDPRPWALLSMILLAAAAFWLSSYDLPASPSSLVGPPALVGLGLGGVFGSWARMGVWGLSGQEEQRAATLLNLLRSTGQAMGIPLVAGLWERRSDLHRHFLVEDRGNNLTLWQEARTRLRLDLGPLGGLQHLAGQLQQQAAMLAFNEIFFWAGWIFLGLACWSLLVRRPRPSGESRAEKMAAVELVEP